MIAPQRFSIPKNSALFRFARRADIAIDAIDGGGVEPEQEIPGGSIPIDWHQKRSLAQQRSADCAGNTHKRYFQTASRYAFDANRDQKTRLVSLQPMDKRALNAGAGCMAVHDE